MASLSNPVDFEGLLAAQLAAQKAEINAHVDDKTTETKAHVTSKSTDTKNHVTSKASATDTLLNTETQAIDTKLDDISKVDGQLDSNVTAINAHTTQELSQLESVGVPIDGVLAFNVPIDKGLFTASGGVFLPTGSVATDVENYPDAQVYRGVYTDSAVGANASLSITAAAYDRANDTYWYLTGAEEFGKASGIDGQFAQVATCNAQATDMQAIAVSDNYVWICRDGNNATMYAYSKANGAYANKSLYNAAFDNVYAMDCHAGFIYAALNSGNIIAINELNQDDVTTVFDRAASGLTINGAICSIQMSNSGIIISTVNRFVYVLDKVDGSYVFNGVSFVHSSDVSTRFECIVPTVEHDISNFKVVGDNLSHNIAVYADAVGYSSLKYQYGTNLPLCVRVK